MLTSSSPHASQLRDRPRSRPNTSSPRLHPKKVQQQDSSQSHPTSATLNSQSHASEIGRSKLPTTTTEHGTQYTPPDWPPTSVRSSLYAASHLNPEPIEVDAPSTIPQYDGATDSSVSKSQKLAKPVPPEPAEPPLRVTPQTSLQHVHTPSHRERKGGMEEQEESRSPIKRTRSHNKNVTILPKDYAECDNKILAAIIADMLMELIRFNDEIPLGSGQLTRFHSRSVDLYKSLL